MSIGVVRGEERTFCQVGEGSYQLTVKSLGIQFTIDRLRRRSHELVGELAVSCELAPARAIDGFLSVADLNLSSAQARGQRAKLLATRSDTLDVDWDSLIEEMCVRTINAERQGSPARELGQFTRGGGDAIIDVDGWPWLRDHAMITFADGGGLKSYLALYGVGLLSQRGMRVGYADWELSGDEHRDRLERLFGSDLPIVHYFRCDKPLVDEVDRLGRESRRLGLEYLVFDSAGFATEGPPENAEETLAYFRAVRQIGLGSHHLAHVNRSDTGDQKPFGSAYWHNSARMTWFAKAVPNTMDSTRISVGLFNRKSNLTKQYTPRGFEFAFNEKTTIVSPIQVADVVDLAGELKLWQRIEHLLKTRGGVPCSIQELADELDAKPDSVKKAVGRSKSGKSIFTEVLGSDGKARIALVARRV
jgi:hypothetical protein